jgi:hypothetical protein
MLRRVDRHGEDERGATAAASILVIALSMVVFAVCANLFVAGWGKVAVRGALDEGVRMGARAGAGPAVCERHVADVLGEFLSGSMAEGVAYQCSATDRSVVAAAEVTFPGWLPIVPDMHYQTEAHVTREPQITP